MEASLGEERLMTFVSLHVLCGPNLPNRAQGFKVTAVGYRRGSDPALSMCFPPTETEANSGISSRPGCANAPPCPE